MKNSTLLFRSLIIIALLAGIPHLFAYATEQPTPNVAAATVDTTTTEPTKNDFILGNWKVDYQTPELTGAIIYTIKKEGEQFTAYTHQYADENGYTEQAERTKTLVITQFDGYKGKGTYLVAYEGKKYEMECQIDMVDENTFKLSYDYYGYADVETWKRA